jgi:hypothetical protein
VTDTNKVDEGKHDPKPPEPILVRLVGDDGLKPFEEQTLAISKRTYRLTKFGFLIALGAAVFVGVQVQEMGDQTRILSDQAITQVANSVSSERLGQKQIEALQRQVDAIQRQMRQDQRAWIKIDFGTFRTVDNQPLAVPWTLVNTGKTPAKHVDGHAVVEIVVRGQTPHFVYDRYPNAHFGANLVTPNEPAKSFGFQSLQFKPDTKDTEPLNMSTTEIAEINDGRAYAVVHGIIRYEDIFKTPHWIKFCTPSSASILKIQEFVKPCIDYNDADDN